MDRPNRIRQLYGYTVCLIAVVTSIIGAVSVVSSAVDLSNPLAAGNEYQSLDSFDAWMAQRGGYSVGSDAAARDTTSVGTLQVRFNALRSSRIEYQRFRARRDLITGILVLAAAVGLFGTHWRWVRQVGGE